MNIEILEARIAPAGLGIGDGTELSKAKFLDADGDLVAIKLKNAPGDVRFDISLIGGVDNSADVSSINLSGGATDSEAILSIKVKPKKLSGGGFGPGFTEIGSIESARGLAGISLLSAAVEDLSVAGDLDALTVDLRPLKVKPFTGADPREAVAFGSITISGDAGAIILRGLADAGNALPGNDIPEAITIGGNLGSLIARFSGLGGALTVGGNLDLLAVGNVSGAANIGGLLASAVIQNLSGSLTATGGITKLRAAEITGSIVAADDIGEITAAALRGADITCSDTIGAITVIAAAGDAISDSTIAGEDGLGDITAITRSTAPGANAISNSLFRTDGSIGNIRAETSDPEALNGPTDTTHGAILNSGFNAQQSIGSISTLGHINKSVFVAGIDLGPDFGVTGAGTFSGANPFGFGGGNDTPGTGAPKIGAITVGTAASGAPGSIGNSTFLAGIIGAGASAAFGEFGTTANPDGSFRLTQDDAFLAGSAIGRLNVDGNVRQATFESGSIASASGEAILVASIGNDTFTEPGGFIAVDPAGTGLGSVSATLVITETTDSPNAIVGGTFQSASSIGNIVATVNGVRTVSGAGTYFGGLGFSVNILAGTTIGDIRGICNATGGTPLGRAYGLGDERVKAGLAGPGLGGIGNIVGQVTGSDAGEGRGIFGGSTWDAAAGTAHGSSATAGGIASITGTSNTTGDGSVGNGGGRFRAIGPIGEITGSTAVPGGDAIGSATISTSRSLGNITATGDVEGSKFLAGFDIGSDLDVDATDVAVSNGSIGSVSVTGAFLASDLIASINPGADLIWGVAATPMRAAAT